MTEGARTAEQERADVQALFARRRDGARKIRALGGEGAERASEWLRHLDILDGEIRAGLHEGLADVMDKLALCGACDRVAGDPAVRSCTRPDCGMAGRSDEAA